MGTSWYREWFGEEYARLYAHRDESEAALQIEFITQFLPQGPLTVLDVACGYGRHLTEFIEKKHSAVGIDLSATLLKRALLRPELSERVARADMRRLPFISDNFDLISSFFTSFGYFPTDEEHLTLLSEWNRVSRIGALLFLDYFNTPRVRAELPKDSERSVDNRQIVERRRVSRDGKRVEKQISIINQSDGKTEQFLESVRMFTETEMRSLFERAGYKVVKTFGDYDGSPVTPSSPRLLLLGEVEHRPNL